MKNELSFEILTKRTKVTDYTFFDSEYIKSFKEYCSCLSSDITEVRVLKGFIVFLTMGSVVYMVFNYKGELVETSSYFEYINKQGF